MILQNLHLYSKTDIEVMCGCTLQRRPKFDLIKVTFKATGVSQKSPTVIEMLENQIASVHQVRDHACVGAPLAGKKKLEAHHSYYNIHTN